MRILLDVMGADREPAEIVRGAVLARAEYRDVEITLVGDEEKIVAALSDAGADRGDFTVVHEPAFISMEDSPMLAASSKHPSSMAKTLRMLADGEGDAAVSCGNTGALFTGATLICRRIPGVRRAALGMVFPYEKPILMLDCGANVTVTSEYLVQFATLGTCYMKNVFGIEEPTVGLLNNGAEPHKGTPLAVETYQALSARTDIRFIGNVEGKDIPFAPCDVLVCDGFTGNISLKSSEGLARFSMQKLTETVRGGNPIEKLAARILKNKFDKLNRFFDPKEYGGAPFLGLARPVIKAHGNSDANAVKNAIRQAAAYAGTGVIREITEHLAENAASAGQE